MKTRLPVVVLCSGAPKHSDGIWNLFISNIICIHIVHQKDNHKNLTNLDTQLQLTSLFGGQLELTAILYMACLCVEKCAESSYFSEIVNSC